MLWEGNEPWGSCFGLVRSQRKGDLGDRVRGLDWDKLLLPIAPWLQASWGHLETCMSVGGKVGEGKGMGQARTFNLRGFKGWEFRGGLRGRISVAYSSVPWPGSSVWLKHCPNTRLGVQSLVRRTHTRSNQWIHGWVEQQNQYLSLSLKSVNKTIF